MKIEQMIQDELESAEIFYADLIGNLPLNVEKLVERVALRYYKEKCAETSAILTMLDNSKKADEAVGDKWFIGYSRQTKHGPGYCSDHDGYGFKSDCVVCNAKENID